MAASNHGQEVVMDTTALVSKSLLALSTPQVSNAIQQASKVYQSGITMLASPEGLKVGKGIFTVLQETVQVMASPENHTLLVECATNIIHALQVEQGNVPPKVSKDASPEEKAAWKDANKERSEDIERNVVSHIGLSDDLMDTLKACMNTSTEDSTGYESTTSDPDVIKPQWNRDALRSTLRQWHLKEKKTQKVWQEKKDDLKAVGEDLLHRTRYGQGSQATLQQANASITDCISYLIFLIGFLLLVILYMFYTRN